MKKLSYFGSVLERIRIDLDLTNIEMANLIGVSPVYLSSLKKREKPIPKVFVENMERKLPLTEEQRKDLWTAQKRSTLFKALNNFSLSSEQSGIIYNLANVIGSFNDQQIQIAKALVGSEKYGRA